MTRVVHLHIGAPKTGTTYAQDRLSLNSAELRSHGVLYPGPRQRDASQFHFRAALDLLGQDWGGVPGHAEGAWRQMVRKVRRHSGNAIISHEILAPAPPEIVARAMRDLAGAEVHVVYSVRDLGRQLPAAWQESIKQGRKWTFERFLDRAERGNAWFARAFDLPRVLSVWGNNLPPERIHVVTVPHEGPSDLLWHRLCEAMDVDPAWAPLDSENTNTSLGIPETQLLRRLNRRLGQRIRRDHEYDDLLLRLLAREQLTGRRSARVTLPDHRYDWAEAEAERWVDWVSASGVQVVGDVDDLRPRRPGPDAPWVDPDHVEPRPLLRASLDALEVMTREAASRDRPGRMRRRLGDAIGGRG